MPSDLRRATAERAAISAPKADAASDLIVPVHDELVFELPEAEVELVKVKVPELMSGVAELNVKRVAEVGVGANRDEAD